MKLSADYPPHIRSRDTSLSLMFDVVVALLPLYGLAVFFYGPRALMLALISAATCILSDAACSLLMGRGLLLRDLSPVVTGMIIPLLLPASISYTVVIIAALFSSLVIKQPFGGVGQNIFNPAAGGVAFVTLCWPVDVFSYPTPLNTLPMTSSPEVVLERSVSYTLHLGGRPTSDYLDLLLGNVPGPMGATHILVMLACLFYLWVRRGAKINMTGSFIAGAAAWALLFPRGSLSPFESLCYELMSGSLLFAAIFLISDPVTSPKRPIARTLYGAAGGLLCMAFRSLGDMEESVIFGILVMNTFVWLLDTRVESLYHRYRRERTHESDPTQIPQD